MVRKHIRLTCMIVALLVAAWTIYSFVTAERYTYVNKTTDQSDAQATQLSIRVARLRTGIDVGVMLLPALPPGETIEQAAVRLMREAKLGKQTHWRAILILYSEADKAMKIEVSQNLEGQLTDAAVGQLERGARSNMLKDRRADFLSELIVTMMMQFERQATPEELDLSLRDQPTGLSAQYGKGGGAVGRGYAATTEAALKEVRPMAAGDAARYKPDANPDKTLEAYLESLRAGVGDPALPLLSDSSRLYRLEWPQNSGVLHRSYLMYVNARPYTLIGRDDVAVAVFQQDYAALPIVLKRADGVWRVDEAPSLALFKRFEDRGTVYQKYPDTYSTMPRGLAMSVVYEHAPPPPLAWNFKDLKALEDAMAGTANPRVMKAVAETLFFDLYWLNAALPLYEQYIKAAKDRRYLWRLVDGYAMTSQIDQYLKTWDRLDCAYPEDGKIGIDRVFYRASYDFGRWHWGRDMKAMQANPTDLRLTGPALWHHYVTCRFHREFDLAPE